MQGRARLAFQFTEVALDVLESLFGGDLPERRSLFVVKQPADIPNGSRYALLNDPQGAAIAVYQSATALEPEHARVYRDATVLLRPKTGLKDMFVELDRRVYAPLCAALALGAFTSATA